jgi:hypothetical protein
MRTTGHLVTEETGRALSRPIAPFFVMAAQAAIHDKYQSYDACRNSLSAPQLLWQLHH